MFRMREMSHLKSMMYFDNITVYDMTLFLRTPIDTDAGGYAQIVMTNLHFKNIYSESPMLKCIDAQSKISQ